MPSRTRQTCLTIMLALGACASPASEPAYRVLNSDQEPLRSEFNAAKGKVRAIFLATPA